VVSASGIGEIMIVPRQAMVLDTLMREQTESRRHACWSNYEAN